MGASFISRLKLQQIIYEKFLFEAFRLYQNNISAYT